MTPPAQQLKAMYFPHDYNASGDDKMEPLIMAMGSEGCGIYWRVVEKLYQGGGSVVENYEQLAWSMREDKDKIKRVVNGFGLFYIKDGRIRSRSADRRIKEREDRSEIARQKGLASYKARRAAAEQRLNSGSTDVELERKKERKKEIRTDSAALQKAKGTCTNGACSRKVAIGSDKCLSCHVGVTS